ncbi:MAG: gamma-glutamylcyclotransferase family protein [Candidatus Woesearchaeota archaeon]
MQDRGDKMTWVIGYGSLMIPESLEKTLPLRPFVAAWVKGYKRVFNLKNSTPRLYRIKEPTNKVAILNVEPSDCHGFNALIFEVSDDELQKLKIREKQYYTKEIKVYDLKKKPISNAILFIGNKLSHGERIVNNEYEPVESYLERCREAAYKQGKEFGQLFDRTTFLGNGKSLAEVMGNDKFKKSRQQPF